MLGLSVLRWTREDTVIAKRRIAVVFLALVLSAPSLAADFEAAEKAYQRGDYATALKELRPLAEQGDAKAQTSLGSMYGKGEGVPQDYAEAMKWHRLAAEQGDAQAQVSLGVMYASGEGVPEDYAEAMKWWRRAAEQGNAQAQVSLGVTYANGEGVPRDYVQAHMWLNLAAARLTPDFRRNWAAGARDDIEERMTPAQVAEAQRLAREWKPK